MTPNLHIFYAPNAVDASLGSIISLDEEESNHCVKVLRLREGEHITVIDGVGSIYNCTLTSCNRNLCSAVIESREVGTKRLYRNHVAIAPTKNIDRFEWFVEKAVEFGVDEITPLLCEHSERKIIKLDRIKKIAISAVKQSGNIVVPIINQLTAFDTFVGQNVIATKLIAHCEEVEKRFFTSVIKRESSVCTLIGPEGDFSEKEINLALNNGFVPVSLGNSRLRTETAGISVCAYLSAFNM